jgi:hypothetical protein
LKKLDKLLEARNSARVLRIRRERVIEWQKDEIMSFKKNRVFIDEAAFNMHLRRNFGRSKRGFPAKLVVPSNRGISVTIVGAICEKGIVDSNFKKTQSCFKIYKIKKKKKKN